MSHEYRTAGLCVKETAEGTTNVDIRATYKHVDSAGDSENRLARQV